MSRQRPGPGSPVFSGSPLSAPLTTCPDRQVAAPWPHEEQFTSSGAFFNLVSKNVFLLIMSPHLSFLSVLMSMNLQSQSFLNYLTNPCLRVINLACMIIIRKEQIYILT